MELLGLAFAEGFSREPARADDDLAALRQNAAYVRLMSLPERQEEEEGRR